jgi:hypothetical protein
MPNHHFAVMQCPMNLFESDVWVRRNTGPQQEHTVLEVAHEQALAVLVNRPLNAMPTGASGMLRLAEMPIEDETGRIEDALRVVGELENEYRAKLAPAIPYGGKGMQPKDFFTWADELGAVRSRIQGLEHWEQIEHQMLAPHINQVLQAVPRILQGAAAEQWENWRDRYIPQLLALLRMLRHEAAVTSRARAERISGRVNPLLPDSKRGESLSRKALWVLASTPGVTCVLNGMRSVRYVEDSMALLGWNPLTDPGRIYNAVADVTGL